MKNFSFFECVFFILQNLWGVLKSCQIISYSPKNNNTFISMINSVFYLLVVSFCSGGNLKDRVSLSHLTAFCPLLKACASVPGTGPRWCSLKNNSLRALAGQLSWQSIILMHQGCGFDPWSGHRQEATNEYINKWNTKWMFLFLFEALPFSL